MGTSGRGRIVLKPIEEEECVMCGRYIGQGHDPAVCSSKGCKQADEYERAFSKFVDKVKKEEVVGINYELLSCMLRDIHELRRRPTNLYLGEREWKELRVNSLKKRDGNPEFCKLMVFLVKESSHLKVA